MADYNSSYTGAQIDQRLGWAGAHAERHAAGGADAITPAAIGAAAAAHAARHAAGGADAVTPAAIGAAQKATRTATLTTAGWAASGDAFTQQVNVTGVTAANDVIVSPAPASRAAYNEAGCYCSAQASGKLTFTCDAKPDAALTVNVLIIT